MKASSSLLLVLLLAACGGGGTPGVTEVSYANLYPEVGMHTDCCIAIRPGMDAETTQAVLRHEIGHALGLGHVTDPRCVMAPSPGYYSEPCSDPVGLHVELVADPSILAETLLAAEWWNARGANVVVR